MVLLLPKRYYLDIEENLNPNLGYGVYALKYKKRFWRGVEEIVSISTAGVPEPEQKKEIKAYLVAAAWNHKNGK